ncbi:MULTISPECIES: hypothetical protein [unclassified Streptomyces]|uniref:hypothetical protein n=1 Tax=Streptomyces sp. NPDC127129 TaxID=3345373 RepID=UPI00362E49FE
MRRQKSLLTVVALCLGGALTACGGGEDEGYAAVGAGSTPKDAVRPSGSVTLIPLDSPSASGTTSSTTSPSPRPPGAAPGPTPAPSTGGTGTDGDTGTDAGTDAGTGTAPGTSRPGTTPARPGTTPPRTATAPPPGTTTAPPPPPTPATPATLTLSAPVLADGDKRWCERVTVTFRNTGGTAATSGTVTFATHIIGALGVDWATIESAQPLPAPIAAGAARTQTYTVCVDSWRVPLGMHVDTRKVTATWR